MANFTNSGTKTRGTNERTETAYWIVALFDTTMILLNPIKQVLARTMQDLATQHATNGAPIGGVFIGGYPIWFMSDCPVL